MLVLLLALGICASSAGAAPLSMTFTEGRANVGVQLDDHVLFGPPTTALLRAEIDPQTGLITGGQLTGVPSFFTSIEDPEADVTVEFDIGEITGSFDQATGSLRLRGDAGGTLTAVGTSAEGTCDFLVPDLELSTEESSSSDGAPRPGVPFTAGLAGTGAIAGQWEVMTIDYVEGDLAVCNAATREIGGPGGVWLEHRGDVVPPAAPQLTGTNPASPGVSGAPRILGSAEAGSNVSVYAGPGCGGAPVAAGSAAQLGAPGIPVGVAEGVTAVFSATATDAVGNRSACSSPIAYTRVKVDPPAPPPPPPACTVPKLVGKPLGRAKMVLRRSGCKLGNVRKPRRWKRVKRKRRWVLVVRSSSPRRGASPADGRVDLRVRPKRRKAKGACTVPKLIGKRLRRARVALRAAGCKVGRVRKPKGWKRVQRKRRWVLVVKASSPRRGVRPSNGRVKLKLGVKRR